MTTKTVFALVCFLIAAILAVVAVFAPPAYSHLLAVAVAALAVGLAVEAW